MCKWWGLNLPNICVGSSPHRDLSDLGPEDSVPSLAAERSSLGVSVLLRCPAQLCHLPSGSGSSEASPSQESLCIAIQVGNAEALTPYKHPVQPAPAPCCAPYPTSSNLTLGFGLGPGYSHSPNPAPRFLPRPSSCPVPSSQASPMLHFYVYFLTEDSSRMGRGCLLGS